jgi:hypothetical protein
MDPVGTGIAAAKELRERGERQRATNEARVAHRIAIKQELADGLAPMLRRKVEAEVLIRDADRQPDGFPKPDSKFRLRRLSPWFKVGVLPSYSGGMSVWLRLDRVFIEDGVARSQVKSDTEEGELVRVVGLIPYDAIVAVDWEGNAEFSGPHVYCHFDFDQGPYEEVVLYREYSDGIWMPMDASIRYKPHTYPVWNRWWLHRKIKKHERQAERERLEWIAKHEAR